MVKFIAGRIEKAAKISEAEGVAKYEAYFINTTIYKSYKEGVDELLIKDGYEYIIPVS